MKVQGYYLVRESTVASNCQYKYKDVDHSPPPLPMPWRTTKSVGCICANKGSVRTLNQTTEQKIVVHHCYNALTIAFELEVIHNTQGLTQDRSRQSENISHPNSKESTQCGHTVSDRSSTVSGHHFMASTNNAIVLIGCQVTPNTKF